MEKDSMHASEERGTGVTRTERYPLDSHQSTRSVNPFSSGIGLLLWGGIALYAPIYLGLTGWLSIALDIVAIILLAISFGITFGELAKTWRRAAIADIGNAIAFLIPTAVLYILTRYTSFPQPWHLVAQLGAILFALLASIFIAEAVTGIPSLVARGRVVEQAPEDPATRLTRRTEQIQSVQNLLIAILSFGTAVVGLATLILRVAGVK